MNSENPHLRPGLEGGREPLACGTQILLFFSPQPAAILEKACHYFNMTDTGAQLHLHTFT